MAVSRAQKEAILATLEAHLKEAVSVGFTSNQKLTVEDINAIRNDVRAASGSVFMLAKKTLIRLAFKNVFNADLDLDTLPGQVAIVISKGADKIAPLAAVNKYVAEFKKEQKIKFVGGYMDGRIMDESETSRLAGLPSREVLLAKLLGSMMSPLSGLARFFDGAKKEIETKGATKVGDLVSAVKAAAPAATETPAAPVAAAPTPAPETVVAEAAPEAPATEEAPAA